MQKKKKKSAELCKLTLSRLQKWVQEASPSVAEILTQYPALKISKVLSSVIIFIALKL